MNATKLAIATVVGGIAYFLLGWMVWGMALSAMMAKPAEVEAMIVRPDAEFGLGAMLVSSFAWSFLLAYIFEKWAGIRTFPAGASAGAIIGFLMALSIDMGFIAMYKDNFMTTTQMLADVGANTVVNAVLGGVIGWLLGRGRGG